MGDEWETPDELFKGIEKHNGKFDLDVCATARNRKVPNYFYKAQNGLKQKWKGKCWCNPPYSNIEPWVDKAIKEMGKNKICMLLPANTDTKWFQKVFLNAKDIVFIRGRLTFKGEQNYPARFPSCLAFFDKTMYYGNVHFWTCDRDYENMKRVSY